MRSSEKPVRILHVVGGMARGGVETWLLRVLRAVDRDRYKLDFLVHGTQENAYDAEVRALGSRIISCPLTRRPWQYSRALKRILRESGPYDVVHSHVYLYSGLALRAAHQAGVPVRVAGTYPYDDLRPATLSRRAYRALMLRFLSLHSTAVTADSQHSLDVYRSQCDCSGKLARVVYCGLDLQQFALPVDCEAVRLEAGLPPDVPLVTYVARFVPHKNHAMVFEVADHINSNGKRAHFVLIGSHGPLLQEMQQRAHGRPDVSVLTQVADVAPLLQASSLFLFPSLHEGFGIVATEAEAAGLPVIATDMPTVREACAPSLHPFMFPPGDVQAAAASVHALLADDDLRRKLSDEARRWAGRFTIERSAEELAVIYAEQLATCS